MITNIEFILKNQILSKFQTGNTMFDMMIGTLLCSIIASLTTMLNYDKIKSKIRKIIKMYQKDKDKKIITFTCKRDYGYPETFKGILYHLNKSPNKYLSHLKYVRNTKYNHKSDIDEDESFFTVDEDKEIKIADDYYVNFLTIEEDKKTRDGTNKTITTYELDVYTYNKTLEDLKDFINLITEEYNKYIINKSIKNQYFIECDYSSKDDSIDFKKYIFSTNRAYDNIFFEQKELVLQKIRFFLNNRDWYDKRGIPYTLGLLLYGDPGCGKTSLIKAIMKETKKHAISINLNNDFDLSKLKDLMLDEDIDDLVIPQDKRIFILEDVDAMGDIVKDRNLKEKENKNILNGISEEKTLTSELLLKLEDKKNNLSQLLNIIDGIIECPGRIIIMTTNQQHILDKALIRPGRIDMKVNFTKCNKDMLIHLIQLFYEKKIDISAVEEYQDYSLTPAEVMEKCFSHKKIEDLLQNIF
jgi:DNA replication protein DnaC